MPMQFIVLPKNQKCIGCHDLSKFAYFILFDEYTDSRVGYFTAKREFHIIPENSRKWQCLLYKHSKTFHFLEDLEFRFYLFRQIS